MGGVDTVIDCIGRHPVCDNHGSIGIYPDDGSNGCTKGCTSKNIRTIGVSCASSVCMNGALGFYHNGGIYISGSICNGGFQFGRVNDDSETNNKKFCIEGNTLAQESNCGGFLQLVFVLLMCILSVFMLPVFMQLEFIGKKIMVLVKVVVKNCI